MPFSRLPALPAPWLGRYRITKELGDRVAKGEQVGRRPVADGKPALGAPVHASLAGTVTAIGDGVVWIEKS